MHTVWKRGKWAAGHAMERRYCMRVCACAYVCVCSCGDALARARLVALMAYVLRELSAPAPPLPNGTHANNGGPNDEADLAGEFDDTESLEADDDAP